MAEDIKNKSTEEEIEENEDVEDQDEKEETGKSGDDKTGKDDKSSKGGEGKTFTQEQVTKMMTKEKNQGRNAVYKELGINPKDSKAIAMVKALIESQKSDEEKAAEKNAEEQQKLEEANMRAMTAEIKAEAMQLGCKSQFVDDLVTLAIAKMSDDSDVKTIIGEFKTKYPVWFGGSEEEEDDEKGKTGQKGTGSSVRTQEKGKGKKGEDAGLGQRLAAQRRKSSGKKSYWGNNK